MRIFFDSQLNFLVIHLSENDDVAVTVVGIMRGYMIIISVTNTHLYTKCQMHTLIQKSIVSDVQMTICTEINWKPHLHLGCLASCSSVLVPRFIKDTYIVTEESTLTAAFSVPMCVFASPRHQHSLHLLLHSRHVFRGISLPPWIWRGSSFGLLQLVDGSLLTARGVPLR